MRFRICCFPALVLASTAPAHATITISTAGTQNMSCAAGVCEPTAATAFFNVKDLQADLASGNIKITTTSSAGVQASDIRIAANLSWSGRASLTLDAFRSVDIDRPVKVTGAGGFVVLVNDGGSKGAFEFGSGGSLAFANLSSPLTINGVSYTLVSSVATLASAIAANASGAFALANSYNAGQDGTYTAAPIPTVFTGSFNGLGNTISNLTINDPTENAYVGLFAETSGSASLASIRLANANVTGGSGSSLQTTTEYVGALAGFEQGGTISNASSGGVVSGGSYAVVGGLAGLTDGMVTGSESAADASSGFEGPAGGLIGLAQAGVMKSSATGNVSGSTAAGGLVGFSAGAIDESHATGAVTGADNLTYAGGLVGINDSGTISTSYATGAVQCQSGCGGLVGGEAYNGRVLPEIMQSFATGSVSSTDRAGGLVGYSELGTTLDSYAGGAVSGPTAGGLMGENDNYGGGTHSIVRSYSFGPVNGSGLAGGLIGYDKYSSTIVRACWDTTTSGITDKGQGAGNVQDDPGIKGLGNAKLRSGLPKGFSPKVWTEDPNINGGLPYLIANPPPK